MTNAPTSGDTDNMPLFAAFEQINNPTPADAGQGDQKPPLGSAGNPHVLDLIGGHVVLDGNDLQKELDALRAENARLQAIEKAAVACIQDLLYGGSEMTAEHVKQLWNVVNPED